MAVSILLTTGDYVLCCAYLLSVLVVGMFVTLSIKFSNKGKFGVEEYYLGGKRLPWWALSIADVSSYIDISGTMINTALLYSIGVNGMYIEIRGGLTLMLAFQLAYTGKLIRRCPVITRGEWIKFRFGADIHGKCARTATAITSIIGDLFMVTYFVVGGGKFVTEFISIPAWLGLPPEFWGAAILMFLALTYSIVSGFTAVVYTDVYQSIFIFFAFVYVSVLGFGVKLPSDFYVFIPMAHPNHDKVNNVTMFEKMYCHKSEWTSAVPPNEYHIDSNSTYSVYNAFSTAITFYIIRHLLTASSGPGGGGLQTVLATKSEKEVRLQTFLGMILLLFRWAFSAAIALLAIQYTLENPNEIIDPERVLPLVVGKVLPSGTKALVISALLAAALTTFDSTIHATSSYWTIDLYEALINPKATAKQMIFQARLSMVVLMCLGLLLSLIIQTINDVWAAVTMTIAGGTMLPFFFAWYWSRFNGVGYCCGLVSGLTTAFLLILFFQDLPEYSSFIVTSTISGIFSIVATYLTDPPAQNQLAKFYKCVRPPGLWHQVARNCFDCKTRQEINNENQIDLIAAVFITIAQISLYFLAVSVVVQAYVQLFVCLIFLLITCPFIYVFWYKRLDKPSIELREEELTIPLLPRHSRLN